MNIFCFSSVCGQAETQADAEDGIKFMQEMIELAKQRNDESGTKFSDIRTTIRINYMYNYSTKLRSFLLIFAETCF